MAAEAEKVKRTEGTPNPEKGIETLPEGFITLDQIDSAYQLIFRRTDDAKAEADLAEYIRSKGGVVTIYAKVKNTEGNTWLNYPGWFPITAFREKIGNLPFFLEIEVEGKKYLLGGGIGQSLNITQIGVPEEDFKVFHNIQGDQELVAEDGTTVTVGSVGTRATKDNTAVGMFIMARSSKKIYEIVSKGNTNWTAVKEKNGNPVPQKYANLYDIADKPKDWDKEIKVEPEEPEETKDDEAIARRTRGAQARRRKKKGNRRLLEQPLRVMSYEGIEGKVPALPMVRIPEPHEL